MRDAMHAKRRKPDAARRRAKAEELQEAAEQMEGTIDRATANLPDPSYPKR